MKKLSRLKTSLFSLPLVLAAVILVFISSDSDKSIVKEVFTDITKIAHADVPAAGSCAAGADCDCTTDPDPGTGGASPSTVVEDCGVNDCTQGGTVGIGA